MRYDRTALECIKDAIDKGYRIVFEDCILGIEKFGWWEYFGFDAVDDLQVCKNIDEGMQMICEARGYHKS